MLITSSSAALFLFIFSWILDLVFPRYVLRQNIRFYAAVLFMAFVPLHIVAHKLFVQFAMFRDGSFQKIVQIEVSDSHMNILKAAMQGFKGNEQEKLSRAIEFLNRKKSTMQSEVEQLLSSIEKSTAKLDKLGLESFGRQSIGDVSLEDLNAVHLQDQKHTGMLESTCFLTLSSSASRMIN